MKNVKRLLSGFLAALLCLMMAANVCGEELTKGEISVTEEVEAYYNRLSGTIDEVRDFYETDGTVSIDKKFITVQFEDEETATFAVLENTFFATDTPPAKGEKIIGYYKALAPMIMIYPPQYNMEVVIVGENEDVNIHIGRYNDQLISDDGDLRLNISDDTKIFTQSGEGFEGEIANRRLVVYYGVSTRSIPALTTPIKIVVLDERPDTGNEFNDEAESVLVNGIEIDAPKPFVDENGVLMIPLRAAAEALGFVVGWDGATKSVTLNEAYVTLSIGSRNYTYVRTAPIELSAAPIISDDKTFVPAHFWTQVLRVNAVLENGQFVISNR